MSLIILIEFHVISFLDIRKPYDQYINILEVPLGILSTFKLYLQKTLSLKVSSRNDRLQKIYSIIFAVSYPMGCVSDTIT